MVGFLTNKFLIDDRRHILFKMSVSTVDISNLKRLKKVVAFSPNSSSTGGIFKYIGGQTLVYKNLVLENNGYMGQIYNDGESIQVDALDIDLNGLTSIQNHVITSLGLTGADGYQVGDEVDKDMDDMGVDPLPAAYAPYNKAIVSNSTNASYWDDWGNDVFDDWGFFYIFDVQSQQYYFPILQTINQEDGIIATETFNAFGSTFTIKHGYPVQGIYKFDVSRNDHKHFIFGAYGNMGSDEDTINTNFTQSYTLNNKEYTLYYNRNIESGDLIERFFSYFIPYERTLNNTKTYNDYLYQDDDLSLYSVPVRHGITVYFAKRYDVKDWVIHDLTNNPALRVYGDMELNSNLTITGTVHIDALDISGSTGLSVSGNAVVTNLTIGDNFFDNTYWLNLPDASVGPTMIPLINGYFTNNTLTDNRNFNLPAASVIVASIPNCVVGSSFRFTINNKQSGNFSRTIVAGAGTTTTYCTTLSVGQNQIIGYRVVVTNATSGSEALQLFQESSH
jgi:hypothetical protein